MVEVGGESVADIDHRRSQSPFGKEASQRAAWLGIEVLL